MKNGWKLVARLGRKGRWYPHILVDPHGWCLRLGPNSRTDDKFYSSLPNLLGGLIEQLVRRHFMSGPTLSSARVMLDELRSALRQVARYQEVMRNLDEAA